VHGLHIANFILHIFGSQAWDEGHNIAKCANRRA
jgi:hypothetical protein